jgi:hypothetical protein
VRPHEDRLSRELLHTRPAELLGQHRTLARDAALPVRVVVTSVASENKGTVSRHVRADLIGKVVMSMAIISSSISRDRRRLGGLRVRLAACAEHPMRIGASRSATITAPLRQVAAEARFRGSRWRSHGDCVLRKPAHGRLCPGAPTRSFNM